MALRNLSVRLKEHDWTSVLIELTIVVAGVFIGLQVSNWNDARKESARGDEYLRRMHEELLKDSRSLEDLSRFWTQVRSYGLIAIACAEDGTLDQGSAWKTLLAYYQASQVWPYRKSDVTFQEIRSSGDLLLIRNPSLRARIANHYSAGAGSQVVEVLGLIPHYRETVRGMTPWRIQQYIWANCYQNTDANQVLKDCAAPVSETEASAILEQYRRSTELTAELRFWIVNVSSGLMLMQGIHSQAEALAQDIERELAT
jgi:hypothetical protein